MNTKETCKSEKCKKCECKQGCCQKNECTKVTGCCAETKKDEAGSSACCQKKNGAGPSACCQDKKMCATSDRCPSSEMCPFDSFFGTTGIVHCTKNGRNAYKLTLPHSISEKEIKITQKGNTITADYDKEIKKDKEYSKRTGSYSFTVDPNTKVKRVALKGCTLEVELEEGAPKDGPLQISK